MRFLAVPISVPTQPFDCGENSLFGWMHVASRDRNRAVPRNMGEGPYITAGCAQASKESEPQAVEHERAHLRYATCIGEVSGIVESPTASCWPSGPLLPDSQFQPSVCNRPAAGHVLLRIRKLPFNLRYTRIYREQAFQFPRWLSACTTVDH